MAGPALRPWLAALLAAVLLLLTPSPALAWPSWLPNTPSQSTQTTTRPGLGSAGLQEVAPPGGVQELRRALDKHRPKLELIAPSDGTVVDADQLELTVKVSDWPLYNSQDFGLGPHMVLQIDDQAPLRLFESENGILSIELPELSPGSHRFSAWAAYPWGEAVTSPGAAITWQLHRWQPLAGTQPDQDAPWLVPVGPTAWRNGQPLLLDWLIWNAPLQNLREGDQRWKLRVSLNGDSVLVDQQEAIWLKSPAANAGLSVQMELLDGLGEPITPVFNNRLIHIKARSGERPAWLKNRLSAAELAHLSGVPPEPEPEPEAEPDPDPEPEPEAQPKLETEPEPESDPQAEPELTAEPEPNPAPNAESKAAEDPEPLIKPTSDQDPEQVQGPTSAETSVPASEPPSKPRSEPSLKSPMSTPSSSDEPLLIPQSSLGGSARDLIELN